MHRVVLCLALLSICPVAIAEESDASFGFQFDARDVAWSFRHGRVQWRIEALDLLRVPVSESFDGIPLGEQVLLTEELLDPPVDLEGERRFFLSVTVGW